jgi:hypothetical protein
MKPDLGELSETHMGGTAATTTTQEIQQNMRQPLYQFEALHVDIRASHAATFIGHRGRNCKFWVNEIEGVSDIFVLGHPDTQGTRKVAIISWYSGGKKDRDRVHDLIMEFNIKTGHGDLSSEWLDAASRTWSREEQSAGRRAQRRRQWWTGRERKQYGLEGTDPLDYFGPV